MPLQEVQRRNKITSSTCTGLGFSLLRDIFNSPNSDKNREFSKIDRREWATISRRFTHENRGKKPSNSLAAALPLEQCRRSNRYLHPRLFHTNLSSIPFTTLSQCTTSSSSSTIIESQRWVSLPEKTRKPTMSRFSPPCMKMIRSAPSTPQVPTYHNFIDASPRVKFR